MPKHVATFECLLQHMHSRTLSVADELVHILPSGVVEVGSEAAANELRALPREFRERRRQHVHEMVSKPEASKTLRVPARAPARAPATNPAEVDAIVDEAFAEGMPPSED